MVRPATISKARHDKLAPEVLRKLLGSGMSQGLPKNIATKSFLRQSLTVENSSAFDEFEFLRKDDDKDLRPMADLASLQSLKLEIKPSIPASMEGHSRANPPQRGAHVSNPPSRASGQRSPLLPLNGSDIADLFETKVRQAPLQNSMQSDEKGSIRDPIILDDLDD
ncbi:hypothetical protein FRB90_009934 [Tulasnella sp. 427]|nr:hypothetical protein FRB90_009934 [Tulasnella sp. 427]